MLLSSVASEAAAQDRADPEAQDVAVPSPTPAPGIVARSVVGQAGQRQNRDQVEQDTGIAPMARIANRIQNRAQTRIRNRIDRYYDPQANAASPFVVAGEQARVAGRRRR
ncbi:hypothetical protein AVT10_03635 [Sphingomonas hankookensis]|uniref:Uncharacterized protein n=2 Tax=Sphingomonas hankookensis TaxID=563996 RepID=A0ABR5YBX2_9SPHN|nr:hypothetical protein AVT10_03635 [Sphingomonas hankookensis]